VSSPSPDALVLVVDDNVTNLKLARDVLRAAGFRTLEAARGRDAIALAAARPPHVILLDLRLPDVDGVEVVRELRADPRTAGIPVVALSALQPPDDDWLDAAGFAGYIAKPISVSELPRQVRSYCAEGR
jgi:two-component system, cell cycle response regulator DivK